MLQLPEEEAVYEEQNLYRNMNRKSYGVGGGGIQNVIQYPVYTVVRLAAVCEKPALSCSGIEKGLDRVHYISGLFALLSSIIFFNF
jgi:hypothetical protein